MTDDSNSNFEEITMADWWSTVLKEVESHKLPLEKIPIKLYEWIEKQVTITARIKNIAVIDAVEYRFQMLLDKYSIFKSEVNLKEIDRFKKMKKDLCITGEEVNIVINIAKKKIVQDMMLKKPFDAI